MKRGEIWWLDFDPSIGGEIKKRRPAVIISNELSNKHLNRVQVVPLTSTVERIFPSEALVTFQEKPNKAMADQLTTASKLRLVNRAGKVGQREMQRVERAVCLQLGLAIKL